MFDKDLILPWLPALLLPFMLACSEVHTGEVPGVTNFHKVDDHVYRGAQPTVEGFRNLAKLGVRTVVDLQMPGARGIAESQEVTSQGMQYVSVPMQEMRTPSTESVEKVLHLLEDRTTGPVFVHCHRGADRTGGVIACYRIEHDHWRSDQALSEARTLGMSWYQLAIQRYVRSFSPAHPNLSKVLAPRESVANGTPVPAILTKSEAARKELFHFGAKSIS
ncbi:MAG TPA: tyrosine-protein phosphatase [Bryobacteraceae bacterium]|jgi:protein tyrosine phosphatase (PTP) superfamily phosphohydrolase (DUF442 family)